MSKLTKEELIAFEEDIANCFNNKQIKAPVHLYHGNEEQMIDVFKSIGPNDWVFTTWRSHYQCLLKGVPKGLLKEKILEGKSISLCFPDYKIFSSAIVGGIVPIAVGVAMAIKRDKGNNRVHVFSGEMTSETGGMWECLKYSIAKQLPIRFIVEDNGKSVCTDTRKTWGLEALTLEKTTPSPYIYYYKYDTKWPHAGAGKRIQF